MASSDGSQAKNLTNNTSSDTMPFWGILGSWLDQKATIAFVSNRTGNNDIYTMTTDGNNLVNVTNNAANDFAPVISGSNLIAFTSNRSGNNNEIFIMTGDGSNPVNLTNNPANDSYPFFSPDNASIAYTTDRNGNDDDLHHEHDRAEQLQLHPQPGAGLPARVAVVRSERITLA